MRIVWTECANYLNLNFDETQQLLWTDWTAPLDSTSCRALAIESASPRYRNAERSLYFHRALNISLNPNEKFSEIKGKKSLTPNPSPKGEGSSIKDLKDLKGFLKINK